MALDEATAALLEQVAASGAQPLHELTPQEARNRTAAMRGQTPPGPDMDAVRNTRVAVPGGYVPLRVLTPPGGARGVIVYYHGGGWVLGGLDDFDAVGRKLAQRTQCVVVMVDYRLAPEYRFPTAVEDSWAALQWTAAHEVTDCDLDSTSYRDPANQLMLTKEAMAWFWDHYTPDVAARMHPDASPLRSGLFYDLPPAVIITAEHDVLRDEGELYATYLVKGGVPVLHQRFDGQMHGFFTMTGLLPGAEAGLDFVAEGIEKHLVAE
jgi:acetyl esterase